MTCPIYYNPGAQNYYVEVFYIGEYLYLLEKSHDAYEDENSMWHPTKMKFNKEEFSEYAARRLLYVEDIEFDDNYIAGYMLFVD